MYRTAPDQDGKISGFEDGFIIEPDKLQIITATRERESFALVWFDMDLCKSFDSFGGGREGRDCQ